MVRIHGAIGRWMSTGYRVRESDNARAALEAQRQELWDAGFETAGGAARPITDDDD